MGMAWWVVMMMLKPIIISALDVGFVHDEANYQMRGVPCHALVMHANVCDNAN